MKNYFQMEGLRENVTNRLNEKFCTSSEEELRDGNQYSNKFVKHSGTGNGSEEGIALYFKYVPATFTIESFGALLSQFGKVLSVYIGKPNQKYLASQLVFSIVKVASERDALNIIENIHRKQPLNLSVSFARTSEEKKTQYPSKMAAGLSLPVQRQQHKFLNMERENGSSSYENNFKGDQQEETSSCSKSSEDKSPERVSNDGFIKQEFLPRMGKCVKCDQAGSKRCSVCKAYYCSQTCQFDDWYYHVQRCRPPPPLEDATVSVYSPLILTSNGNGEVTDVLGINTAEVKCSLRNSDEDSVIERIELRDEIDGADVARGNKRYSFTKLMMEASENSLPDSDNEHNISIRPSVNKFVNSTNESLMSSNKRADISKTPPQLSINERHMSKPQPKNENKRLPQQSIINSRRIPSHQEIDTKTLISKQSNKENDSQKLVAKQVTFPRESASTFEKESFPANGSKIPSHQGIDSATLISKLSNKEKNDYQKLVAKQVMFSRESSSTFEKESLSESEKKIISHIPNSQRMSQASLSVGTEEKSLKKSEVVKERKKFLKEELYTQPVEDGGKYAILPTWYEGDTLYVQLFSDEMKELTNDLVVKLMQHCANASVPDFLVKGEIICAFVSEDKIWYRGEVMEVDGDKILVFFIDFGNTDLVLLKNIRVCDSKFMQVPIIAIPVKPICEVNIEEEEARTLMMRLIDEVTPLLMDVKSLSPHVEVELWDAAEKSRIFSESRPTEISEAEMNARENAIESSSSLKLLQSGAVKPLLMMYDECKSTSLPLGDDVEVVILQPTNPLCCFLTPKESIHLYEELEILSVQMNEYCNSLDSIYYKPQEGEICLAKFSKDGLWYRGCCLASDNASAEMIFVDYGNHEVVLFKEICQMIDKFLEIPLIALHCQIQGFTLEDIKTGGSSLDKAFQEALPAYSSHSVKVLSKCTDSNVYKLEIPSLSVENIKMKAFT